MRVVAGACRGRPLLAPEGFETRPTSDRVREAVFNALGSLNAVQNARFVDLFAGSGAMGIEALSRGAEHCTFVDRNRQAREIIHQNLKTMGLVSRAEVVGNDVLLYLQGAPTFDVAIADPPYQFDDWPALLAAVDADIVVMESNRPIEVPTTWSTVREKRYGGTVVLIVQRAVDG